MTDIFTAIGDWMGLGLEARDLELGHMAIRAVIAYVLLVGLARLGHQRLLDRTSPFDIILGILLGSIASRAITGNAPFFPAIGSCAVLIALHAVFAAVSFRSRWFSFLVKGRAKMLMRDAAPDRRQMRLSHVAEHDIDEALRLHGITERDEVKLLTLERNGKLSLVRRDTQPKVVEVSVAAGVQKVRIQLG
jgi:uncharacterized membrane protein YcaP (DUF421 family)